MFEKANKYVSLLQTRFPDATVKWEQAPESDVSTRSCILSVTPKVARRNKFRLEFPEGLGSAPVEQDVEYFIKTHGVELDKR